MQELLVKKFADMGARLKVNVSRRPVNRWTIMNNMPRFNILKDARGEYFDMSYNLAQGDEPAEVQILDLQPKDRHLLLMVRGPELRQGIANKSKFLMGHDERHWFIAAIPEVARGVSGVITAKQALQPKDVRLAIESAGVNPKEALKRKNDAYLRQGEWFFLPVPGLAVNEDVVIKDEPLVRGGAGMRRGGSKPHMMEFCYRTGGETVYVNRQYPSGITTVQYNKLSQMEKKKGNFRAMVKDAGVYAKGKISHADHATLVLPCWHRIVMNTENQAAAMRHVAFLD